MSSAGLQAGDSSCWHLAASAAGVGLACRPAARAELGLGAWCSRVCGQCIHSSAYQPAALRGCNVSTRCTVALTHTLHHTGSMQVEEQKRRAEADKLAAITALEQRSREFMMEKEEKRRLEARISSMQSQLLIGGHKIEDMPAFRWGRASPLGMLQPAHAWHQGCGDAARCTGRGHICQRQLLDGSSKTKQHTPPCAWCPAALERCPDFHKAVCRRWDWSLVLITSWGAMLALRGN